jgi:hypothetical protein
MIDVIRNVSPQWVITAPNNAVFGKTTENKNPEKYDQKDEETKTKNVIENGTLIVEQYDKHGKLICKTPPGYLLLGEKG